MARVAVIGGGIVGICSAYYLRKAGHDVTVIDQSDLSDGCSFGNAGMIVPSHFIPLAAPGMISKGIRWMFDSTSPFYVRPRLSGDLIRWGYYFYKHATAEHVCRSIPALKELSLFSKAMYQQLARELPFEFGFEERGLLMLYQNEETAHEEAETAVIANRQGIEAHVLTATEVQKLEPDVQLNVLGGVYFPGDAHLAPNRLMAELIALLKEMGVRVLGSTLVTDFEIQDSIIKKIIFKDADLDFDEVVVATGSWSGAVMQKLHIDLPMQAGKGYSFTLPDVEKNVRVPSILLEARVAVTPMGHHLRFGGTMEIGGLSHSINMNRVRGIVNAIPRYYPEMRVALPPVEKVWHGLRPCSPDGLPFIGRSKKINNLVIATGHSMMGLSLGPGTGKLVAELIAREKVSVPTEMFNPERFD